VRDFARPSWTGLAEHEQHRVVHRAGGSCQVGR
jgi:hypothetical protein